MVGLTDYTHFDSATLATMLTEAEAERTRLLAAGQAFGLPGGRNRTGVTFDALMAHIAAIRYAQSMIAGTGTEVTYADVSGGPL
jgi:hypothetical protein